MVNKSASAAWLVTLFLLMGMVSPAVSANALAQLLAPKAEAWSHWRLHDDSSTAVIDHSAWGGFMQTYLREPADGINRLAYASVSVADRRMLGDYIEQLATLPIANYNRNEQLAYWINLYNALTVKVVLEHYPVASIRDIDISPGLFASGPWDKALVTVDGQAITLNDIEHRILRPLWQDPRIHYAVNCASLGCPNLQLQPFTGANADQLLDTAARMYINHPRGVFMETDGLMVSSIYNWFAADFEVDGGVIAHLRRYAHPVLKERLGKPAEPSGYMYDWSLNDAPTTSNRQGN